ncbi:MAG: phosphoribosylglycinamide formyltransferase [Gammaproteobacteria bacterium]|nr:phosphoribosylglycinamide formyltransferase [Gammaproteobacteria bacterium]MDH5304547.1 phosphoribosylglycinamide formyltransferase [Gammaproteobacteria bacterium]MDH5322635.1 phosphoribosylglycinamide formyltransferase [Gammaproteobacteria bacterium]
MNSGRCRAAILISGSGSNLQAFIDQVARHELALDIVQVVSNRDDAFGLKRAANAGIATRCLPHAQFADRESFDRAMARALDDAKPDLLMLAGFMRVLSPWFVAHFEGRILNIHPALLPAYPGLNTHQRVLDAGERWHGSTVHFVTAQLDGGPGILQGRLAVRPGESAVVLAQRVQAIEHRIYPEAAALFASGRLEYRDGMAWLDGERLQQPLVRDF